MANHSPNGNLKAEDIILLPTKYDYGCGTNFPIDQMSFYRSDLNLEIIEKVNDFEYGLSKPQRNQEPYMRIFVRDPSKYEDALIAFKKYSRQFERPEFVENLKGEVIKKNKEKNAPHVLDQLQDTTSIENVFSNTTGEKRQYAGNLCTPQLGAPDLRHTSEKQRNSTTESRKRQVSEFNNERLLLDDMEDSELSETDPKRQRR